MFVTSGTESTVGAGMGADRLGVHGLGVAGFDPPFTERARVDPILIDTTELDDEDLCDELVSCEDLRARLDARQARVSAELERRSYCDTEYGLPTGNWLAAHHSVPVPAARKRVQVSTKLAAHFPAVLEALADGHITWAHAEAISDAANERILQPLTTITDQLVAGARGTVFHRWKQELRGLVELLDQDGGHDPNRDQPDKFHFNPTAGGHHASGFFSDELAIPIAAELHRVTNELYRQTVQDHKTCPELAVPSRAQLAAQALGEICRRSAARDLHNTAPTRPEVIFTFTLDTAPNTPIPAAVPAPKIHTTNGVPVRPETVARLCGDATWRAMWLDANRVPLDLGRTHRHATAHQRAALTVRDGGCVFPGCDKPAPWTDAHHIQPWEHNGPTNLKNLALLCRHHHGVTHRNHWTMNAKGNGTFTWTTPTGHTLHSQQHHRQTKPPRA